jgi:hypothetical protein
MAESVGNVMPTSSSWDKSRFWIRFQNHPKINVNRTPVLTNSCAGTKCRSGLLMTYPSDLVDGFAGIGFMAYRPDPQ